MERKRYGGRLEDAAVFRRRKFCDQKCMAKDFDQRPEKPTSLFSSAHWHSRKAIPKGPCQECGTPKGIDVHHIDRDFRNNDPSNLIRLCRTCHNLAHDRAKRCVICGARQKGLGYCEKHYQRFKKYGDPLLFKRNQHSPLVRLDD
jgi:hypothetical protein